MEKKGRVIGIGEALWDVLPEGKKLGGAPANFAFHAKQMGLDSIAISALGNDDLGDETIAAFDEKELTYLMPRVDYPTGYGAGEARRGWCACLRHKDKCGVGQHTAHRRDA